MANDIRDQLVSYLKDAHALEQQSLQVLGRAVKIAGDPQLEQLYHGHILETKEHDRYVSERLEAYGESPSTLKDAASRVGAVGLGLGAQAAPDTPGRLAVAAYAFEHLEIASYELLKRVARLAGDEETVNVAERILDDERLAAEKIAQSFDMAAERSLEEQGAAS